MDRQARKTWFPAKSLVELMHAKASNDMSIQPVRLFPFVVPYHIRSKEILINLLEFSLPFPKLNLEGFRCDDVGSWTVMANQLGEHEAISN